MIRLAAMSSVMPDWTLDETIAGLKKHGFTGYEPRVEWKHKAGIEADLSADARREARKKFEDAGLSICCIATGQRFAMEDAAERAQNTEALKKYVDLAGDLGAKCVRVFGGKLGKGELTGIVRYVAAAIRPALDNAKARGVTVCIETHDDWCRAAQVRAVAEELDHPAFGILWDIMHTQRVLERPAESFAVLGDRVRHMHVHDGRYSADGLKLDTVALGEGVIHHAEPIKLLKANAFDGFVSVEVIHKVGEGGAADAVLANYGEGLKRLIG